MALELFADLPIYRRVYRRYLRRFAFFRALKRCALAVYFPTRRLTNRLAARWRSAHPRLYDRWTGVRWWLIYYRRGGNFALVPLSVFGSVKRTTLDPGFTETIPGPQFVNASPPYITAPKRVQLHHPTLEICEYRDATVLPGSNLIIADAKAVHSDFFIPERDVCHSERVGAMRVGNGRIKYALDPPRRVDAAISLLGQCAGNYAHFLTEVVPRLLIADSVSSLKGLPVILDAWIDPAHRNLIDLFNTENRRIIESWIGQPLFCRRLIDVSPCSYAPPEYRDVFEGKDFKTPPPDVYCFNRRALALVRERAHDLAPAAGWVGRKLYISRKIAPHGNARSIVNVSQIDEMFREKTDFDLIEPGALLPQDQIALFREARVVVAPAGAALANLVFTEPGCKVICLAAHFKGAEYNYWSNLMETLGHRIRFVVGPQTSQDGHPLHRNYRIPIGALYEAIQS